MNVLKSLIKEVLLTEKVFGAQAFVYHGSKTPPDQMLDILENDKFAPGAAAGAMYGKGLYTIYEEDKSSNTFSGRYGKYVYKLKVNLYGFIIFDAGVCQKVYGKNLSIRQQLEFLGETDAIEYLASKSLDTFANQYVPKDRSFSSNSALKLKDLTDFVKGIVFTGRTDGKVVVIYDPQSTVPVSWSKSGKKIQWQKWDRENIKKSLQRSALGEFEPGKYNFDPVVALKKGVRNFRGDLDLADSEITSLPAGLTVGGNLTLRYTKITSLPAGLTVGGNLNIKGSEITSLSADLTVGGYFELGGTEITSLPAGLKVGGSLYLDYTEITSLPAGLTVGGTLNIDYTKITSFPPDLDVGGTISIRGFRGDKSKVPIHLRKKLR
jgi:hypothetical protein